MQSSPPVRAWQRESQYSIDLCALGLDDQSNEGSPIARPRVDRVLSEDMDGPSDFTLNMEKWMRGGGTLGRGTRWLAKSALQRERGQQQEAHDGDEDEEERQERQDRVDETLEVPSSPAMGDEEGTQSHHTPDHSPPKESPWHEQPSVFCQGDAHHDTSAWDPYAPSGTPQPPEHKQFLQPTVEDYYSELTPARHPSTHVPSLHLTTNSAPATRGSSRQQSEPGSPGRPSSETLSPVRSPVLQRSAPVNSTSPPTEPDFHHRLQAQMQRLQARCQQLESLNSALKQALDEEQRVRHAEKAAHSSQAAEAAKREHNLLTTKDEARRTLLGYISGEKEKVRAFEAQMEEERRQRENDDGHYAAEVEALRDEIEMLKSAHEDGVGKLRDELESAKGTEDVAKKATRVLREEHEVYRRTQQAELERQRSEAEQAKKTIADLEARLEVAKKEAEALREAKASADDDLDHLRTEIDTLKLDHEDATTVVSGQHAQALKALKQRVGELERELRDEQASHDAEVDRLTTAHEGALKEVRVERDAARDELEARQSLLNDAVVNRDAARDEVEVKQSLLNDALVDKDAAEDNIQSLRAVLANTLAERDQLQCALDSAHEDWKDRDELDAALEARISDRISKRESYWRARLEEAEREKKVMAKALMRQWGREELGVREPEQAFEYQFVTSKSPKSPRKAAVA